MLLYNRKLDTENIRNKVYSITLKNKLFSDKDSIKNIVNYFMK